jgi:UDP-N-acetylglucosamine acyltransferase
MAIHDVCRILFQSDLNYLSACDKAEAELPQSPERDYLINFVRSSKRGCIKPYVKKSAAAE